MEIHIKQYVHADKANTRLEIIPVSFLYEVMITFYYYQHSRDIEKHHVGPIWYISHHHSSDAPLRVDYYPPPL